MADHLGQPPPRCRCRIVGKRIQREETAFYDFTIAHLVGGLLHTIAAVKKNVVPLAGLTVEVDLKQNRRAGEHQIALLPQFLFQSLQGGFAMLQPAARHVPAGDIGMLDQKDVPHSVETGGANAHRHSA